MHRCLVKLSVRYDGQSQSESEHTSLIDEHARLILWQTGSIVFWFEHWICSSGLTDKHTHLVLFGNAAWLNLQYATFEHRICSSG